MYREQKTQHLAPLEVDLTSDSKEIRFAEYSSILQKREKEAVHKELRTTHLPQKHFLYKFLYAPTNSPPL